MLQGKGGDNADENSCSRAGKGEYGGVEKEMRIFDDTSGDQ